MKNMTLAACSCERRSRHQLDVNNARRVSNGIPVSFNGCCCCNSDDLTATVPTQLNAAAIDGKESLRRSWLELMLLMSWAEILAWEHSVHKARVCIGGTFSR